jgi:hypothetical protein
MYAKFFDYTQTEKKIRTFPLKILREIFICLCVIEKFRVHLP